MESTINIIDNNTQTNQIHQVHQTNQTHIPNDKLVQTLNSQPIINLGCLGSVSDGKSTLVERLTGIRTQRHSSEQKRNITIKQGYGNMKIWNDGTKYYPTNSKPSTFLTEDGDNCNLVNHISFVDCPGHQELIQTMLSAISLMDGAIIVVAVDQPLDKKPQLIQHLAAAKLGNIDKIIICMNKIDLVSRDTLWIRKEELDSMLASYDIKPFAIIPTCFNKKIGLDPLLNAIMLLFNPSNYIERTTCAPLFRISRTFDINKPGTSWENIVGGVMGGSLISGTLKVGDEIEIRPGQISKIKDSSGVIKFSCQPIQTKILSIQSDENAIGEIVPGGLMGIRTDIDPFYAKNDILAGNIAGFLGTLPNIFTEITIETRMVRMFGFIWDPKPNDLVVLQIGTQMVQAKLTKITESKFKFDLAKPTCISDNQHIIICQNIDKILRIVGEGTMVQDQMIS